MEPLFVRINYAAKAVVLGTKALVITTNFFCTHKDPYTGKQVHHLGYCLIDVPEEIAKDVERLKKSVPGVQAEDTRLQPITPTLYAII